MRLITASGTAFFLARGSTQLAAAWGIPLTIAAAPATLHRSEGEPSAFSARAVAEQVLLRNIFDATTGPLSWLPASAPDVASEPPALGAEPDAPACPVDVRLVASIVDVNLPERSMVAIEREGKSLLYGAGGQVADHKVVAVGKHRVLLRSDATARTCELAMFEARQGPRSKAPAAVPTEAAPAPTPRPGQLSEAELDAGIKRLGATRFEISRELLNKVLANRGMLMRAGRVIPTDGDEQGAKLLGIRRDGVLAKLGLENGDILRAMNGFQLGNVDSALEAYSKLRDSNDIALALMRGGKPVTLEYVVR